jgi:tRNA threonylcarbamoyladenosine biosynthesis protein TsaE
MIIDNAKKMFALGVKIGQQLKSSDVIVLTGELGSGKTLLTQGIGHALGFSQITSPTFVLARVHRGQPNLVHVDAYRLLDAPINSFSDLDLATYLESSIFVIEWGIDFVDQLTSEYLEILISMGEIDNQREVTFNKVGKRWQGFSP